MKLINHLIQRNNILAQIRDINGFTADYIMHHLYELDCEEQREVIYNLCCNLYRSQQALELILTNEGSPIIDKDYHPESFESVKYLELDLQLIVADFIKEQEGNSALSHYRKMLCH